MPGDLSPALLEFFAQPALPTTATSQPLVPSAGKPPEKPLTASVGKKNHRKHKKPFGDVAYQEALKAICEFRKLDFEKPGYREGRIGSDCD